MGAQLTSLMGYLIPIQRKATIGDDRTNHPGEEIKSDAKKPIYQTYKWWAGRWAASRTPDERLQ